MIHPSLWRTVGIALTIALIGNVLLARLSSDDDAFANVIAVASGIAAIALVVARIVAPRYMGEALLLSFAVWVANGIEFALQGSARWESQVRQCGFYLAFAILSLGAYLATRREVVHEQ